MKEVLEALMTEYWAIALLALGYALSQARRVTNDTLTHLEKFSSDQEGRRATAQKAVFNFYLVLAAVLVFAARILEFIGSVLFTILFLAVLGVLGVKVAVDALEAKPPKPPDTGGAPQKPA